MNSLFNRLLDDQVRKTFAFGMDPSHPQQMAELRGLVEACYFVCAGDLEVEVAELTAVDKSFAALTRGEQTDADRSAIFDALHDLISTHEHGWSPWLDQIAATLSSSPVLRRVALVLAASCAAADGITDDELKHIEILARRLGIPDEEGIALIHEALGGGGGSSDSDSDDEERTGTLDTETHAGWYAAIFGNAIPEGEACAAFIEAACFASGRPTAFAAQTLVEIGAALDREAAERILLKTLERLADNEIDSATLLASIEARVAESESTLRNAIYLFAFEAAALADGDFEFVAALADRLDVSLEAGRKLVFALMKHEDTVTPLESWSGPTIEPSLSLHGDADPILRLAVLGATTLDERQLEWLRFIVPRFGVPSPSVGELKQLVITVGRDTALHTMPALVTRLVEPLDAPTRRAAYVIVVGCAAFGTSNQAALTTVITALGISIQEGTALHEKHILGANFHLDMVARDAIAKLLFEANAAL